jgi:hypothetical protein
MRTAMGVEMSPRAVRIYGWLQGRGIHLHPFSTDEDVRREMPQLQAALRAVEAEETAVDGRAEDALLQSLTDEELRALKVDLGAIMSRTPDRRVGGGR